MGVLRNYLLQFLLFPVSAGMAKKKELRNDLVGLLDVESRGGFTPAGFVIELLAGQEARGDGSSLPRRFARAVLLCAGSRDVCLRCGTAA